MTPTWYNTEQRIQLLQDAAKAWIGTPFAPNSSSIGRGVSCQKLAGALYSEAGYGEVDIPDVPISHSRFSRESFVEPWFAARPDFEEIQAGEELQTGDILGFQIGHVVHHLGVYLGASLFVHCLDGIGTTIAGLQDATWQSRHVKTWRPKP